MKNLLEFTICIKFSISFFKSILKVSGIKFLYDQSIFFLVGPLKLPYFITVEISLWWSGRPATNLLENLKRALWFVKNGLCMLDYVINPHLHEASTLNQLFFFLFFFSSKFTLHTYIKLQKNYIKLKFKVTSFSIPSWWKSKGATCRKPFAFIIKSLILTTIWIKTSFNQYILEY